MTLHQSERSAGKKVLIPIAEGVEDIETVTQIDVLRRAKADVRVASIESELLVTAARGTRILADCLLADVLTENFDLISLPGGLPGAERLRDCAALIQLLHRQRQQGRWYAAICASPAFVLAPHGLLQGLSATCFPTFRDRLEAPSDAPVVVDGCCVTSQGPGTALAYSLKLVELLLGMPLRQQIAEAMLFRD